MFTAMFDRCGEPDPSRAFGPPLSPSLALGVGQISTSPRKLDPPLVCVTSRPPRGSPSLAVGVAHAVRAHVDSDGVPFVGRTCPESAPFCELPYSSAVGVGYSSRSHVDPRRIPRDDEDPLSTMRRSNVGSSQRKPERVIPAFGKITEDSVKPSNNEGCNVLHDDEPRSYLANDAPVLEPETAPSTVKASAFSRERDVLAREAPADDVDRLDFRTANLSHVVVDRRPRPPCPQNRAAGGIGLALPRDRPEPGPLQAKLEPAEAGEERSDHFRPAAFTNRRG